MSAGPYSLRSWLFPGEPRRVAILYLIALPLALLGAFAAGLLLQGVPLAATGDRMGAQSWELLGSWHGAGMVLLVFLPAIPAGLGYAVFGRPAPLLAAASWYVWLLACAMWFTRLVRGEQDPRTPAGLAALSLSLTFFALILAIRRLRPLGPLAWSIVLAGAAWFVRMTTGGAEPAELVPVALVPALGVVAEVIRDSTGGSLYGARLVPWLLGACAAATSLPWGSRLLIQEPGLFFAWLSPFAALPPAALVAALLATAVRRPPIRGPAVAFAWVSIGLAIVCGGAFLLLSIGPTNAHLAATAFEAAHLHYMAGVVLAAFMAGLHHWGGAFACRAVRRAGSGAAGLVFGAWNLAFFPGLVAGYLGLPSGPDAPSDSSAALRAVSLLGSLILAVALAVAARQVLHSWFGHVSEAAGRRATSKMSE